MSGHYTICHIGSGVIRGGTLGVRGKVQIDLISFDLHCGIVLNYIIFIWALPGLWRALKSLVKIGYGWPRGPSCCALGQLLDGFSGFAASL